MKPVLQEKDRRVQPVDKTLKETQSSNLAHQAKNEVLSIKMGHRIEHKNDVRLSQLNHQ